MVDAPTLFTSVWPLLCGSGAHGPTLCDKAALWPLADLILIASAGPLSHVLYRCRSVQDLQMGRLAWTTVCPPTAFPMPSFSRSGLPTPPHAPKWSLGFSWPFPWQVLILYSQLHIKLVYLLYFTRSK